MSYNVTGRRRAGARKTGEPWRVRRLGEGMSIRRVRDLVLRGLRSGADLSPYTKHLTPRLAKQPLAVI